MSIADVFKASALVFCAAVVQVSLLTSVHLLGGTPDLVLVVLVSVALLRGSVFGAIAGFAAGLVVDTATLQTLGLTSLLLTLAGYWIGRYGETTGRDRTHAPFLSVGVVTILFMLGALVLHYMLGVASSARGVLINSLPPELLFDLLLTLPVYALCRRLFSSGARPDATEVRLLG